MMSEAGLTQPMFSTRRKLRLSSQRHSSCRFHLEAQMTMKPWGTTLLHQQQLLQLLATQPELMTYCIDMLQLAACNSSQQCLPR